MLPVTDIPGQWWYLCTAGWLVVFGLGAWARAWWYDRARGRMRCRRCGYPAVVEEAQAEQAWDRLSSWACPECGWTPRRLRDFTRTRRSRKWFVVGLLLFVGASQAWYAIHVQHRRHALGEPWPTALTPTTWWIAVLPHRSGNEDLIVYHRAYPWGKLAGGKAQQRGLPGSSRVFSVTHRPHSGRLYSRDGRGTPQLPRWQSRWAAVQFRSKMEDNALPIPARCDAVWLYATFSQIDERDEVAAVTALVSERDSDLTGTVLDQFFEQEVGNDLVAAAAAAVIQDSSEDRYFRLYACEVMAYCGEACEDHIQRWIDVGDVEMADQVYYAIHYASLYSGVFDSSTPDFLVRLLASLLNSPHDWHHEIGLDLLAGDYANFWRDGEVLYSLFTAVRPALEDRLENDEKWLHEKLRLIASLFVEGLEDELGQQDERVIRAWGWLLAQPDEKAKLDAIQGLNWLQTSLGHPPQRYRAPRAILREVVEVGLERELSDDVRHHLEQLLQRIEVSDEAAVQWEAARGRSY